MSHPKPAHHDPENAKAIAAENTTLIYAALAALTPALLMVAILAIASSVAIHV